MMSDNEIYPVVVFEGNDWEASVVMSLLGNAEVEAFIKDERMGVIAPWNVTGGGAGPVQIFVSNVDCDKAKEVVDEFDKAERGS